MARTYTKLVVTISGDTEFIDASLSAKYLYMMLISMPKLSPAGCIELRPAKWSKLDKSFTSDTVLADLAELQERGFIMIDDDTDEVFARSFIKIDGGVKNRNMRKSVESSIGLIESPRLRKSARQAFDAAVRNAQVEGRSNDVPDGDTNGVGNTVPDADTDEVGNDDGNLTTPTPTPSTTTAPEGFDVPFLADADLDEFDQAVNAAIGVRRKQTNVTNERSWLPAVRDGIVKDYGYRIRQLLNEGQSAVNAGRMALGESALATARKPGPAKHPTTCMCEGNEIVPADPDDESRSAYMVRCPVTEWPDATVHQLRGAS